MGNFFGVDAKTGLLILLLYVAILFELIHATVIFNEFNHWRQRRNLEGAIKSGQNRYFELTNKRFNARDFTDKSVIDLDEIRDAPENGTNADGGYKSSSPGFGFVPNKAGLNNGWHWDTESPQPVLRPNVAHNSPALFKYQEPAETKQARKQPVGFVQTDKARKPEPKPNGTGRHNPALGTAEEHYELPIAPPAPAVQTGTEKPVREPGAPGQQTGSSTGRARSDTGTGEPVQTGTAKPEPDLHKEAREVAKDLYPDWRRKVAGKEITPGKRDAKRFISQSTFREGDKVSLTVQEMDKVWALWQLRAVTDGVLKPNPNYSNGKPKYILVS